MMNQIDVSSGELYITDITTVREQPTGFADSVVTVCQESVGDNVGCRYYWYNLKDVDSGYGGSTDYADFATAMAKVVQLLRRGDTVVVHCHHGVSRSAAVCIAAVAVVEDISYEDAYDRVETARDVIDPKGMLVDHARRFITDT